MVTIDEVLAALRTDKPWSAMDSIVCGLQSQGHKVKDISDHMATFWDSVSQCADLTEDQRHAFGDTMDDLMSFCRSGTEYTDPQM